MHFITLRHNCPILPSAHYVHTGMYVYSTVQTISALSTGLTKCLLHCIPGSGRYNYVHTAGGTQIVLISHRKLPALAAMLQKSLHGREGRAGQGRSRAGNHSLGRLDHARLAFV